MGAGVAVGCTLCLGIALLFLAHTLNADCTKKHGTNCVPSKVIQTMEFLTVVVMLLAFILSIYMLVTLVINASWWFLFGLRIDLLFVSPRGEAATCACICRLLLFILLVIEL